MAILVKESLVHVYENGEFVIDYGAEQYYLLGIKTEWQPGGATFTEDDSRTFYECRCSKAQLIDFLKEFQRKMVNK
mgnify:CR=1 FL=1